MNNISIVLSIELAMGCDVVCVWRRGVSGEWEFSPESLFHWSPQGPKKNESLSVLFLD